MTAADTEERGIVLEQHDAQILSTKLTVLHEDVGEIKLALGKLSDAITKLALVEERQTQTAIAMERVFKAIEKLDERITLLERGIPDHDRIAMWFERATWAAVVAVALFIARSAGLI